MFDPKTILVKFRGRQELIGYTSEVLGILKRDPNVTAIWGLREYEAYAICERIW